MTCRQHRLQYTGSGVVSALLASEETWQNALPEFSNVEIKKRFTTKSDTRLTYTVSHAKPLHTGPRLYFPSVIEGALEVCHPKESPTSIRREPVTTDTLAKHARHRGSGRGRILRKSLPRRLKTSTISVQSSFLPSQQLNKSCSVTT